MAFVLRVAVGLHGVRRFADATGSDLVDLAVALGDPTFELVAKVVP